MDKMKGGYLMGRISSGSRLLKKILRRTLTTSGLVPGFKQSNLGGGYQTIKLSNEVIIEGKLSLEILEDRLDGMAIKVDSLKNKKVLDVGASEGYFAFALEKLGANVRAIDTGIPRTFVIAKKALNSSIQYRKLRIQEVDEQELREYDIILMLGVFQILDTPLEDLQRILTHVTGVLVCEVPITEISTASGGMFLEILDLDRRFYRIPNQQLLQHLARKNGIGKLYRSKWKWEIKHVFLFSKNENHVKDLFDLERYDEINTNTDFIAK